MTTESAATQRGTAGDSGHRVIRVLFFSHSSLLAGAERSLLELVRQLIDEGDVVCSVVLPAEGPLRSRLQALGASTLLVKYGWWSATIDGTVSVIESVIDRGFQQLVGQLTELRRMNPDVVVTNTLAIPWGALAAHLLNKPHVWFVREYGELDHGLKFGRPLEEIISLVKGSSNVMLVNSKSVAKTHFGPKVPDNVHVFYPDVTMPTAASQEQEADEFRTKNATKLIIYGAITEGKRQEDAILAVRELVRRGKNVELVVMGSEQPLYLERLKGIVSAEGLGPYVHFVGFKNNPYSTVRQADIVLVCSRSEAFGRVVVEGMLLKKAVIATNAGGIPELIQDGDNGLLYEPGNHVQLADRVGYLVDNREKIIELGECGYRFAMENFADARNGARLAVILRGLRGQEPIASPLFSQFVEARLMAAIDVLSAIRNTWSWRLTKPLRISSAAGRLFTRRRIALGFRCLAHGQFGYVFGGLRSVFRSLT